MSRTGKAAKSGYVPQPGTIPARVVAYLQEQRRQGRQWVPSVELAEHVGQPAGVIPFLDIPVQHGCLKKRPIEGSRRKMEYALGDGTPLPKPEDLEPDEPLHPVPSAPGAAPLFPPAVRIDGRQPKPGRPFHAGLFTDGTLSIKQGDAMLELDAQQTGTLARLLRGWSETTPC